MSLNGWRRRLRTDAPTRKRSTRATRAQGAISPPRCPALPPDHIFVFGSNLAGRHGAGAAKDARSYYGAIMGQGVGRQGQSYAIPTRSPRNHGKYAEGKVAYTTLALTSIGLHVREFVTYARAHPELTFQVTRIGCGLAGYEDREIAPLFKDAPENCVLPTSPIEWRLINA